MTVHRQRGSNPVISESTILVGIDDTDTLESEYGTGKISRLLGDHLDERISNLRWVGSVRQQLLLDPRVPYTTHNSSATLVCEGPKTVPRHTIVEIASNFIEEIAADGSDPGICVGRTFEVNKAVQDFGITAGNELVEEQQAYDLADESGLFLEEYGGTGEGVIGALAGVGRTASREYGRFIEYGKIRTYSGTVTVTQLRSDGIDVQSPAGAEIETGDVVTAEWVRPLLRGGRPVLEVDERSDGLYRPTNVDR